MGMGLTMEQVQKRAEKIQANAHKFIESTGDSKASYQDRMNIFLIAKLAELEMKIEELETARIEK